MMSPRFAPLLTASLLTLGQPLLPVALGSSPAIAQTTQSQIDRAQTLTSEGLQLTAAGKLTEALAKQEAALALARQANWRLGEGWILHNLGLVYVQQQQFAKAVDYYQQALTIQRELGNRQAAGTMLSSLGTAYRLQGDADAALAAYQEALALHREFGDRRGAVVILGGMGLVYRNLNQYAKALAYYQQALQLYEELGNQRMAGVVLTGMGAMHNSLGQYAEALAVYQRALAIHQQVGNRAGENSTLNNIGTVYSNLGQYTKAETVYQQSLALDRELGDRAGESTSLSNLGEIYSELGQYAKALEYFQQSLAIKRELGDRAGEGIVLMNLGVVHDYLGQPNQALASQQQALAIAREVKNRSMEAVALHNLGTVHWHLKQHEKALAIYQQVLTLRREIGDVEGEGVTLNNMGVAYADLGQHDQALAMYQQALALHRRLRSRPGEGSTLNNIGSTYRSLQQYDKALAAYQEALAIQRKVGDRQAAGIILNNMGAVHLEAGNPQAAIAPLSEALTLWEALRPGLTDDSKVALFETQAFTYRFLQRALIAENQPEAALEVAERGRARAFVELLASRLPGAATQPAQLPPPDRAQIRQIARDQNATLVQYSLMPNRAIYIWVITPNGTITFREVSLQANATAPTDPTMTTDPQALVNLVNQTRVSVRGLGAVAKSDATTAPTAPSQSPLDFQADPRGNRMRSRLRQLHTLLIAPIADLLPTDPAQRVVFIPQGALFLVPFPALLDANDTYLVERHTLLTAPSIQTLALTRQQKTKSRPPGNTKLIVGNPVMPNYGTPPTPLTPLPGAEREARAIGQFFNTPVLLGDQATETAVKQQLQQARLVHLATHGLLDDQQALNSALALTPTPGEDGFLTAAELLALDLQADLVVLSACDTGRGRITGDGVIGLSRSLISAGVPSVIVSLWAVPDGPTAELMVAFYRYREQGLDKAQALRQAMLQAKAQHPHPINWAAFTLIGEAE